MQDYIREADWKVLRRLKPVLLERYCERALNEIVAQASEKFDSHHERYLAVFKLVDELDEDLGKTFERLSRSNAVYKLANMYALDLITREEYAQFSGETRDLVLSLIGYRYGQDFRKQVQERGSDAEG